MESGGGSLYDILNVSKDATQAEIKRAYRRLSGVFHPDKQPSDDLKEEAAETFAEIKDAYEVCQLSVFKVHGRPAYPCAMVFSPTVALHSGLSIRVRSSPEHTL